MFHLVSLSLQISLTVLPGSRLGLCVWVVFVVCFVGFCWFLSLGKFVFNHRLTPVVDRPSLAPYLSSSPPLLPLSARPARWNPK